MKQLKKTILTLVALLAVTTGAWAQTETLLTTITATAKEQASYSTANVATVSFSYTAYGYSAYKDNWGWWGYGWIATVTAAEGYTITKCIFYDDANRTATDSEAPFVVETTEEDKTPRINETPIDGGKQWSEGIMKIEVYGYVTPAASSGPEVSGPTIVEGKPQWTFSMPGGNVTLEPEYYPQAALTAAPTAINDVPATTDGAIVEAGTVANIGETATAQGTVMYYVSPTALDDAALLALAADKWKADVPTAADLAQGQAYVYYYVRGNDSDTDEENFSDGDILATNALTVTIAAEPLWNAEFDLTDAPEEDKAGKWSTDIPEGGVVKGTPVTVTYTGSKKVIGVKAEKKAAAGIVNPVVGQIIGSDGKNYDANATLPSGVTAVAKIAYVGNDAETSTTYNHGLALALGDVSDKKAWCSQYQKTCLTTQYGSADAAKGDMAGIANTDALVNHTGHSHAAASAARDYNGGTHPMGTSEWFLPSAGQWDKMASAAGGYVKLRTNAGLQSDYYWSSTERDASYAWYFSSHNGDWLKDYKDMYSHRVRACLAF